MADIRLVNSVKEAMFGALKTAIDAGASAGVIDVYTAPRPTLASDAATGTQLGTLTFSDPCCTTVGSPTAGRITFGAITQDSSADATGVAAWARISSLNSGTRTTVGDIDVGVTGSGAALQMNTINIVIGGPILISSAEFTL